MVSGSITKKRKSLKIWKNWFWASNAKIHISKYFYRNEVLLERFDFLDYFAASKMDQNWKDMVQFYHKRNNHVWMTNHAWSSIWAGQVTKISAAFSLLLTIFSICNEWRFKKCFWLSICNCLSKVYSDIIQRAREGKQSN